MSNIPPFQRGWSTQSTWDLTYSISIATDRSRRYGNNLTHQINFSEHRKKIRMPRIAVKMKLNEGYAEEYKKRHDAIWPELASLLTSTGVSEYSIFLDEDSNTLFGVMNVEDPKALANLPDHPVMQRWWKYMSDIMASNADHSPVSTPLKEVFYLP